MMMKPENDYEVCAQSHIWIVRVPGHECVGGEVKWGLVFKVSVTGWEGYGHLNEKILVAALGLVHRAQVTYQIS